MANIIYGAIALTGGTEGALDALDGAILNDGDGALVLSGGRVYFYKLDAASGQAESVPHVIAPDFNPDTKRWILQQSALEGEGLTTGNLVANGGTIPEIDTNGQLPLPFAQTPILVDGQDLTYRNFYVDAVNGRDYNPGTDTAPFATIEKAVYSVPVGGYGHIYLTPGQTYTIESQILITNRRIFISGDYSDRPTIKNISYSHEGLTRTHGFSILNGQFSIEYCNLVTADYASGTSEMATWEGFIKRANYTFGSFQLYRCDVSLGDTDLIRLPAGPATLFVDLYYVNITRAGATRDAYIVYNEGGVFGLASYNASLPSGTTWNDFIYGMVKDANGVPRNVISNIVL